MTRARPAHIGLFDSGIGGLSVLRALRQQLPQLPCTCVADTRYTPWGERPADWVQARCLQMAGWLIGQAGADSIYGGDGADSIDAGGDNDFVYGGAGDDYIIGGAGADTLRGDGGADRFVFAAGSGADTIVAFEDGVDRIDLYGYAGATFANTAIAQIGADTRITLTGGETILLIGITATNITAGDFLFS